MYATGPLKKFMRKILKGIKSIVLPFLVIFLLLNFVFINAYVPTGSMESTIAVGSRVFGVRFLHNYKRGDIIVFKDPDGSGNHLIKRIIGMPGDKVEMIESPDGSTKVAVNGAILEEPYLKDPMNPEKFEIQIPDDGYFVMGDNRNDSYDARYWTHKIIHEDEITGIAVFIYWPFQEIRLLR